MKMKKLQMIGLIVLVLTIGVLILWRITSFIPDWCVRVNGIIMMLATFVTTFSTTRIVMSKGRS